MEGGDQKSIVYLVIVVKVTNQLPEIVLVNMAHFVFAVINSTGCAMGFVGVHSVADADPAQEIGDPWFVSANVFAQDEVK